jgi:acyl carrier protein
MEDVKKRVLDILIKQSIIKKDYKEEDFDDDLLQTNVIDSLNIVVLINIFEEKFGIEFTPDEILSKNWNNVNAIISTIGQKLESIKEKK